MARLSQRLRSAADQLLAAKSVLCKASSLKSSRFRLICFSIVQTSRSHGNTARITAASDDVTLSNYSLTPRDVVN